MTEYQQKLVKENYWVVNSICRELGLQGNEDMYANATLCLNQCAIKFNVDRGVCFSTFAYKSIRGYLLTQISKENKIRKNIVSDQKMFYLPSKENIEYDAEQKLLINKIKGLLNERELQVFVLKYEGRTIREMCEILGVSHTTITCTWKSIKEKAKNCIE